MKKRKVNISGITKASAKIIAESEDKDEAIVDRDSPLLEKIIGLSVSDSEEYKELGFDRNHQKDITIELSRYLLVNGAHLVYGGDLRKEGYSRLFAELSFQYRNKEDSTKSNFTNYLCWPIFNQLQNSDEAEYKRNRVIIKKCTPPSEVPKELRKQYLNIDTLEHRHLWALSLTLMRNEISEITDAQVFTGGNLSSYYGLYPGILEEAALILNKKKPFYLIGAFGGATNLIIRAIKGEEKQKLINEIFELNPTLISLYDHVGKPNLIKNLNIMLDNFKKLGVAGLSKLNGLTSDKNEILFNSVHFHELIYHLLTGLRKKL